MPIEYWESGWIPCSERLPEEEGNYIISFKMKYKHEKEWEYNIDAATYSKNFGYLDGLHWTTINDWYEGQEIHVEAWQPLPEPYKEKE